MILYVYTIQHSKGPNDVYQAYFAAAERCQQQIVDIAEEGSLTSRYCLVLEELRAEAVRQTSAAQSTQIGLPMETGNGIVGSSTNIEDMAAEFAMTVPDLVAMGQLNDFHVSPSASLEDLTGWGHFESMVGTYLRTLRLIRVQMLMETLQIASGFNGFHQ